jgi:serine/threonine protein kinase
MAQQFRLEDLRGSISFGGKSFFAIPSFLGASSAGSSSSAAAVSGGGGGGGDGKSSRANVGRPRSSPTSVVVGRHEFLRSLSHPHLCEAIELTRSKHDRIFLVSEHYGRSLRDVIRECETAAAKASATTANTSASQQQQQVCVPEARLVRYAAEIVMALDYLAQHNIVHRNLHLDNILVTDSDHIKLADYGMYYISNSGREVSGGLCVSASALFVTLRVC